MIETDEGYCISRILDVADGDEVAPQTVARWAEERAVEAYRAVFDADVVDVPDEVLSRLVELHEAACRVKEVARKAQYTDREKA